MKRFHNVLIANRGEIAIRICRAYTELGDPHSCGVRGRRQTILAPLQSG